MNRDQLKDKINIDITSKIEEASITPTVLGDVLDEMADSLATTEELNKVTENAPSETIPLESGNTVLPRGTDIPSYITSVGKTTLFGGSVEGGTTYTNTGQPAPDDKFIIQKNYQAIAYYNKSTDRWSLGPQTLIPVEPVDGTITEGDIRPISGDTAFKAIDPINELLQGDYFNTNVDFSGLTTSSGGSSTFINLLPVTVEGPLFQVNVKAPLGVTITPVVYNISGTNGSYVFSLLKEYNPIVITDSTQIIQLEDDYKLPLGSYVGLKSSNGIYNGTYNGINMVRVGFLSHNVNTAAAYNYTIKTDNPGMVRELNEVMEELDNAPYKPIPSKNIYNKDDITENKHIAVDGSITDNQDYFITGFIPVTPGLRYKASVLCRHYCYFNAEKEPLTGGTDMGGNSFTPGTGRVFVRISIPKASTASRNLQIEQNSVTTGYRPFGVTTQIQEDIIAKSYYSDKILVEYGDSLVQQERWQFFVLNKIPMRHFNRGIGGTLLSSSATNQMANLTRLQAIPECDLFILNGGMNDWRNNIPIGTINDITPGTLLGGLYTIINYISSQRPNTRMYVNTIPLAMLPTTGVKNSGGLTTLDYSNAIIQMCRKYNIPVIDIAAECGWNEFNIDTYVDTEPVGSPTAGERVHFNLLGGERVAQIVIKNLNY